MMPIEDIAREASKLTDQELREALAMAKGMDAANKLNQEQGD